VRELLYGAEMHGCDIKVIEAPGERHIGLTGIVVRDSQSAFHLVTPDDRLVLLPKKSHVFEYRLDGRKVVILLAPP